MLYHSNRKETGTLWLPDTENWDFRPERRGGILLEFNGSFSPPDRGCYLKVTNAARSKPLVAEGVAGKMELLSLLALSDLPPEHPVVRFPSEAPSKDS